MNADTPNRKPRIWFRRRGVVLRTALVVVPLVLIVMGATQSAQSDRSAGPALVPINPPPELPGVQKTDAVVTIPYSISPQRTLQFQHNGQVFEARSWDELSRLARKCHPGVTIQFVDSQGKVRRTVQRAMIGILLEPIEGAVASQLRLDDDSAILIQKVYPGLPADKAGMRQYDVLVECNEIRPLSQKRFSEVLSQSAPGDVLNFVVLRAGSETELHVRLAPYDSDAMAANSEEAADLRKQVEEMIFKYEERTGEAFFPSFTFGSPLTETADRGFTIVRPEGEAPAIVLPQAPSGISGMSMRTLTVMGSSTAEQRLEQIEVRLTKIEQMLEIVIERSFPEGALDLRPREITENVIVEIQGDRERDNGKDNDQ